MADYNRHSDKEFVAPVSVSGSSINTMKGPYEEIKAPTVDFIKITTFSEYAYGEFSFEPKGGWSITLDGMTWVPWEIKHPVGWNGEREVWYCILISEEEYRKRIS